MTASLRIRLAAFFALAVTAALLLFSAVILVVVQIEKHEDHANRTTPELSDENDKDSLEEIAFAMTVALPLGILGSAWLGYFLAGRAVAPLREASQRARAARSADLDLTLPMRGTGDEWDELAETLNTLLSDARASMLRIRQFTADAAHELRTPLTVVIGEADLALRRERSVVELRTALTTIRTEASRLAAMVNGLLLLARADSGVLTASAAAVDLEALIRSSIEHVERAAHLRPSRCLIKLAIEPATVQRPLVKGDPVLLGRVLENLLDNAVRHGGGDVTLTASFGPTHALLRVEDQGPGIPPDRVAVLFERFGRVDPSRTEEGFGLGLSIAREIARAHGGELELTSSERGAAFRLQLPLMRAF